MFIGGRGRHVQGKRHGPWERGRRKEVCPYLDKVEQDDHLDDEEEAGANACSPGCRGKVTGVGGGGGGFTDCEVQEGGKDGPPGEVSMRKYWERLQAEI